MSLHYLERKQFVKASLDEVWDFFSRPDNLVKITPPSMNFEIRKRTGGEHAYAGQMIEYKVSVPPGLRVTWLTEITQVQAKQFFVDEQRVGPYKIWHHEHHFVPKDGGVEMTDIVTYQMPFGLIGELGHWYASKQLNTIFKYRIEAINRIFG